VATTSAVTRHAPLPVARRDRVAAQGGDLPLSPLGDRRDVTEAAQDHRGNAGLQQRANLEPRDYVLAAAAGEHSCEPDQNAGDTSKPADPQQQRFHDAPSVKQ